MEHELAPFGDAEAHLARRAMEAFGIAHEPRTEPFCHGDSLLIQLMEACW